MKYLVVLLVLLASNAFSQVIKDIDDSDQNLRMTDDRCEELLARYNKKCSPTASPSPAPTSAPACENAEELTTSSERAYSFAIGQSRCFRFDVTSAYKAPFVQTKHRMAGNVECARLNAWLYSPTGGIYPSDGNSLNSALPNTAGRWFWLIKLIDGCTVGQYLYWAK